jgi:hypothetical protein
MEESLLDRVAHLERSNRRWKTVSAILVAALVGVLGSGVFFHFAVYRSLLVEQQMARAVAEQARAQEMVARAEAQRALEAQRQAEAARRDAAGEKKQ